MSKYEAGDMVCTNTNSYYLILKKDNYNYWWQFVGGNRSKALEDLEGFGVNKSTIEDLDVYAALKKV